MDTDQTDMLAATRQLDCCKLLFVIFLERRAELRHEIWGIESEGFNICDGTLAVSGTLWKECLTSYDICELWGS